MSLIEYNQWGPATKINMIYGLNRTEVHARNLRCDRETACFQSGITQMVIDGNSLKIQPVVHLKIHQQRPIILIDYQFMSNHLDLLVLNRIKSHTYSLIRSKVTSDDGKKTYYTVEFEQKINLPQQFMALEVSNDHKIIVLTSKEAVTLILSDLSKHNYERRFELIRVADPIRARIIRRSESHYYVITASGSTLYFLNVRIVDNDIISKIETYDLQFPIYAFCVSHNAEIELYLLSKNSIHQFKPSLT